MKKIILLLLFIYLLVSITYAHDPVYRFPKQQDGLLKIVSTANGRFLITREYFFDLQKDKLKKIINFSFSCNDATVLNDNIILATDSGMTIYSVKSNTLKPYLRERWNKKVDHVLTDGLNRLWFSSMSEGVFFINHDSIINLDIEAPAIYCISNTPDNYIWVGTNVGLYKISSDLSKSKRYAEEGIEGYSIPDNLVEKLYPDKESNIWAQLSETIVFISHNQQDEDVPAFDYIGDKENKIFDVVKLQPLKDGYLFATVKGIILLKNIAAFESKPIEEIHSSYEKKGVLLKSDAVRKPADWKDLVIKNICSDKHFTWFVTEKGAWRVKNKNVLDGLQ